jgi:hypothetical protein
MTRLPEPGKDIGTWGGILNDFLTTAHNPDGSLKSSALRILDGSITTPQLADNAVTDSKLDVATQTTLATVASKYTKPAGGVPLTDLSSSLRANLTKVGTSVQQVNNKTPDGSGALTLTAADVGAATTLGGLSDVNVTGATNSQVLSYNTGSSKWTAATVTSTTVNDASNTGKGILQLAGDLGGSNDPTNPTISTGAITDAKVATGAAISQSKIQNLTTNLAAKAPLANPTFSGTVTVPTPANPTDATTKGYVDGQVATGATPDASPSTKGKIQLAGDLAGTAASPTVAKLSGVSLAGLATGLLKNTTGTGVPSIATASDIPDLSATYATATALTTEASTARTAESKAVPRWAPTTTYTIGQQVVSPNNDVVSAIAGFTSGASYVPANWAVSSTFAPLTRGLVITNTNVPTIPAGTTIDNLSAYYNSGTTPITVAGVTLAAATNAVWAWVSGAWVLLSSAASTPVDPGDTTAPVWTATLTTGTPTATSVVVAASALATDNVAVTGYRWRLTGEATSVARSITPSGLNFTLDTLTASTTYAAPIFWAVDGGGNKSAEVTAQGFTTAAPVPVWTTMHRATFTAADNTAIAAYTPELGGSLTPQGTQSTITIVSGRTNVNYVSINWPSNGLSWATTNGDWNLRISMDYTLAAFAANQVASCNMVWGGNKAQSVNIGGTTGQITIGATYVTATETSGITTTAPLAGTARLTVTGSTYTGQTWTLEINGTLYRQWTVNWLTTWGTPTYASAARFGVGGGDVYASKPVSDVHTDNYLVEYLR